MTAVLAIAQTIPLTADTGMGVGIAVTAINMDVSAVETAAHRGNAIAADQTSKNVARRATNPSFGFVILKA